MNTDPSSPGRAFDPSGYGLGGVLRLEVEGGTLHVETAGAGPPLYLLHGWTLDSRLWCRQFAGLLDRYRLVALDRRGFGLSTAPPDIERETDDILKLADQLGHDRFTLWGMSQGGRISCRFAVRHADRLSGLILQSSSIDGAPGKPPRREAIPIGHFRDLARAGRLGELRSEWLNHPVMACDDPRARAVLEDMVASYDARDLLIDQPPAALDVYDQLSELSVPATIFIGEHDTPWRRKLGRAIAARLPEAAFHAIPGAGHFANLTHPADVHGYLR